MPLQGREGGVGRAAVPWGRTETGGLDFCMREGKPIPLAGIWSSALPLSGNSI